MTVRTSVLWKMNIHMAKKGPEMVVQRSYIKGHSFPYRLYVFITKIFWWTFDVVERLCLCFLNPLKSFRHKSHHLFLWQTNRTRLIDVTPDGPRDPLAFIVGITLACLVAIFLIVLYCLIRLKIYSLNRLKGYESI